MKKLSWDGIEKITDELARKNPTENRRIQLTNISPRASMVSKERTLQ